MKQKLTQEDVNRIRSLSVYTSMFPRINAPELGDQIYVPTQLFLSHGEDDFLGGIATVNRIIIEPNLIMVGIEEASEAVRYNWAYLKKHQEEWAEKYWNRIAHEAPDFRTEFNKHD